MGKPPFQLNSRIVSQIATIQELLGELKAVTVVVKPSPKLRKENKIRTVHHSLAIEGNTLTEAQVTALLENKRVVGPQNQILEVRNALEAYDKMPVLNVFKEKDLLKAHQLLMNGLIEHPGKYRSTAVGIIKGAAVSRMTPPAKQVPHLMSRLFDFLTDDKDTHLLIKACVFHYELEFIHPFVDGNGRMGRLWQQRILMEHSPFFEYLAVETWIHRQQKNYYQALEKSDVEGSSTRFIEFSLGLILKELKKFKSDFRPGRASIDDRIDAALLHFETKPFTRKDYHAFHSGISAVSASRDLAKAVSDGKITMTGMKATARYRAKQ